MIIGIGIDIEEVERIREAIERHGERFVQRVFTPGEVAYFEAKANKWERYAARFAAKEAAMKAIGTGWDHGVGWRDVEVVNEPNGCPTLVLHGRAQEIAEGKGCKRTWISLSHTRRQAVAQVVLEGE
jgi:holo-[acyl-carrier protein] synthase